MSENERDRMYMQRALELAKKAAMLGETPVGAVIVKNSADEIIAEGYNFRESSKNPLTHAEIIAINGAAKRLGGWRLIDCTLYCTLEPCPMCTGAIINSRIERVVFGAKDKKAGSCGSVVNLFSLPYNHSPKLTGGVLEEECAEILSVFFKELREKKRANKFTNE